MQSFNSTIWNSGEEGDWGRNGRWIHKVWKGRRAPGDDDDGIGDDDDDEVCVLANGAKKKQARIVTGVFVPRTHDNMQLHDIPVFLGTHYETGSLLCVGHWAN